MTCLDVAVAGRKGKRPPGRKVKRMAADSSAEDPLDLPDRLLEEAAIWHARLLDVETDPGLAAARRADFERWLQADPRHGRAFEEARRLWDRLEAPVAQVMAEEPAAVASRRAPLTPDRPQARRWKALAACVLILAAGGAAYHEEAIDRLRSDHVTAIGERVPLELEDGSRITLNGDTALAIDLGQAGRHVHLFRGEAWFEVVPERGRPFVVETPSGRVRVTGTSFNVRLDENLAIVSLTEGRVELTSAEAGTAGLSIEPGQQARLAVQGISQAVAFDRTAVTAWLRGQLVFYDTPLDEVVAELNRYRGGRIIVANRDLEGLKISGVFRTDDPDAALSAIADTLPVRVTRITDYLVLLR